MATTPLSDENVEQHEWNYFRHIRASKVMFASAKHTLHAEVQGKHGAMAVSMKFPDTIACYNESNQQALEPITDAAFYVCNKSRVVVMRDHLPHSSVVRTVANKFRQENVLVDDGPINDERHYGRPHVAVPPNKGQSCNLIVEAEFQVPVVVEDKTQLRFVVTGFAGTDTSVFRTDWITGKELVKASQDTFLRRRNALKFLKDAITKAGLGGQVSVAASALFHSGMTMEFMNGTYHASEDFRDNRPIQFKDSSHAILTNFTLMWHRAGKKRALAVGSASVVFRFDRPCDATETNVCAACLECTEGSDWRCSSCAQILHAECIALWKTTCATKLLTPSCPLCRAPLT